MQTNGLRTLAGSVAGLMTLAAAHGQQAQSPIYATQAPGTVSPVVQGSVEPTVGGGPSARPIGFQANAQPDIRDNVDGKQLATMPRRWHLLLGFTGSAVYDDNIFLVEDDKQEDFIFTLSPSIGVGIGESSDLGRYASLIYTPSFVFFADHSDENAIEHAVDFTFRRNTERWKTAANFAFRSLSGSDSGDDLNGERIGERVDRETYTAGLRVNYIVSDKTSLEFGLAANYTDYAVFIDTLNVVNQDYVDYMVTGKTSLGLGFGLGYAEASGGPEQYFEQLNGRVRYNPTSKISLSASAGVEFRQVDGGDDQENGIFGVGIAYAPFDGTTISLDAHRSVNPSSVAENANYVSTGVSVLLRQRILHRFFTSVSTGYENTEYQTIAGGEDFSRNDNYYFIRPSVEFQVHQRVSVAVFYEHRKNESGEGFEFANNRAGVSVGVSF